MSLLYRIDCFSISAIPERSCGTESMSTVPAEGCGPITPKMKKSARRRARFMPISVRRAAHTNWTGEATSLLSGKVGTYSATKRNSRHNYVTFQGATVLQRAGATNECMTFAITSCDRRAERPNAGARNNAQPHYSNQTINLFSFRGFSYLDYLDYILILLLFVSCHGQIVQDNHV